MGCDIHFYVEKKIKVWRRAKDRCVSPPRMYNTVITRSKWISADKWSEFSDRSSEFPNRSSTLGVDYKDSFEPDRSFILFAVFANVENEWGLSHQEVRGLPRQMSKLVRNETKYHALDNHSHSWISLPELINIDLNKIKKEYDLFYKNHKDDNRQGEKKYYDDEYFTRIQRSLNDTIEKMKKLDDNPENVRCVFWFDN